MKKVVLGAGILLGILITVLAIRTAGFTSKQLDIPPANAVDVDVEAAAARLATALQYPTISGLESSSDETPYVDSFHVFLEEAFPELHASLKKEVINTSSLLYFWPGQNPDLDPVVFMGHMDVVPIEPGTEEAWDYPPFSGKIADGYIWGRGALDDKNGVLGPMEAVEMLIKEGHQPERTVILAFGHDEEIGGLQGAKKIAERLDDDGIEPWLVLDEGGIVLVDHSTPVDAPLALIGIAEKGYISLNLTVHGEGGHSSMPGRETAIGILSGALHRLSENPFPARLQGVTGTLFDYIGPEMALFNRTLFANRWLFGKLIVNQLSQDPSTDAVLRTTTAPTMLKGSPKDNVLPSQAQAVVNFRILPGDTGESVINRVRSVIDDSRVEIEPANDFVGNPTSVSSTDSEGFNTLQKTIHELFPEALVAPYLVVGGTDAKHFSPLSSSVYRFMPVYFRDGDLARIHGTNERVLKEDYGKAIRFYRQLILNATDNE